MNRVLILVALLTSNFAFAQVARDAAERASDKRQVKVDKATLDRDGAELTGFRELLNDFEEAFLAGDEQAASEAVNELRDAMEREVQQARIKVGADRAEKAGSKGEVRSENRDIRRDRLQGEPGAAAGDRRDRRDDRRDVNDDRRDLNQQRSRHEQMQFIAESCQRYIPFTLANSDAMLKLFEDFEKLLEDDLQESAEELGEDRRELHEDRRESRESLRKSIRRN